MAKRTLSDDIDEQIITTTIKIGAENGVKKCSARKVAAILGIDHAVVIRHFDKTRGLLDAAAVYIDTRGMEHMRDLLRRGLNKVEVFDLMLNNFVQNADDTLYYNSYINSFGFDPTTHNERGKEFLKYSKIYFGEHKGSDLKYLMAWDYVTTMAFYYAEKIIKGYVEYNDETLDIIHHIIFDGLHGF